MQSTHFQAATPSTASVWLFASCLSAAACLGLLAAVTVDNAAQGLWVLFCLVSLLILRLFPRRGWTRALFLTLAGFMVLRYLGWRTFHSLDYSGPLDFAAALALYGAELYGILVFFLGVFVNSRPMTRCTAPLPAETDRWPTVDVLIPTFDESAELLRTTLTAARALDYPPGRFRVYLLDDGGTTAKRQAADSTLAAEAGQRHTSLQALCEELGATYLTRADNRGAKCGNLNAALPHIHGELILVLDADHIPARDFLQRTVGGFLSDPRLFLVQTPHFFINPDPIEKNLGTFNLMPSENAMFYDVVQPGLDFWGASLFCGSAGVIRRAALDAVGGFRGDSITEDAETALHLHAQGWRSIYLPTPLISGLQPQTFRAFVIQRMRWAQGMVQIFRLHNPLFLKGLTLQQRVCYLANLLFWFFPVARLIYLLAPVLFLVFGLQVYAANLTELLVYTLPYMAVLVLANHYLFGRVRWFLVSEVYETMLAYFSLPAVLTAFFKPGAPRFRVTPKNERLQDDFISPLAQPFYAFIAIVAVAVAAGCVRLGLYPDKQVIIGFTLVWALINLAVLTAALGALMETRQRRSTPRLIAEQAAELRSGGSTYAVTVKDLSVGGVKVVLAGENLLRAGEAGELRLRSSHDAPTGQGFQVRVCNVQPGSDLTHIGLQFAPEDPAEYRATVLWVHGDSGRWQSIRQARDRDPGLLASLVFLVSTGVWHGFRHLGRLVKRPRRAARRTADGLATQAVHT